MLFIFKQNLALVRGDIDVDLLEEKVLICQQRNSTKFRISKITWRDVSILMQINGS